MFPSLATPENMTRNNVSQFSHPRKHDPQHMFPSSATPENMTRNNVSATMINYISQLVHTMWLVNFKGRVSLYGPFREIIDILLTSFSRSLL